MILNPVQWPQLDPSSSTALFDQLRVAVIDAVRDGRLPAGTRLPTVRDLAGELGLAVNTVARAYRELESAGIVEARNPTEAAMAEAARRYAEVARALGLGKREALGYLDAEFD